MFGVALPVFILKNSKLPQKSKIKNLSLSFPSKSPGHSLVPRPIICQNLALLITFLKKIKFTHSGTSIPVSNISTEIAI